MRERGFSLILILVLTLGILGTLSGIAYTIRRSGYEQAMLEVSERDRLAREEREKRGWKAATGLETDRAKAKIVYRTITREVDRIVTRDVYRNQCLDADGLRLARCAIRGEGADTCKPDEPLPGSPKPSGRDGGDRLALDYRIGGTVPGLPGEAPPAD